MVCMDDRNAPQSSKWVIGFVYFDIRCWVMVWPNYIPKQKSLGLHDHVLWAHIFYGPLASLIWGFFPPKTSHIC